MIGTTFCRNLCRMMASLSLVGILALPGRADATFSGGDLGGREAAVTFSDMGGGVLGVRLDNTAAEDVLAPDHVLTAVFFNLLGAPVLAPFSAVVAPGSAAVFGGTDSGGVVGGEWAFGPGAGFGYGISSSGFGIYGAPAFPGTNLQGPAGVDGLQYGLTSAGDDPGTGNAAVTGDFALVQHAVDFQFTGLPDGFDFGGVHDVFFQYGTSLDEPGVRASCDPEPPPSAPEPCSFAVLGLGAFGLWRRRRARA
jgi:MYXO-CTERM domain-containing protein